MPWENMFDRGNSCYTVGIYVVLREFMLYRGNICLTVGIYFVPWDYLDG